MNNLYNSFLIKNGMETFRKALETTPTKRCVVATNFLALGAIGFSMYYARDKIRKFVFIQSAPSSKEVISYFFTKVYNCFSEKKLIVDIYFSRKYINNFSNHYCLMVSEQEDLIKFLNLSSSDENERRHILARIHSFKCKYFLKIPELLDIFKTKETQASDVLEKVQITLQKQKKDSWFCPIKLTEEFLKVSKDTRKLFADKLVKIIPHLNQINRLHVIVNHINGFDLKTIGYLTSSVLLFLSKTNIKFDEFQIANFLLAISGFTYETEQEKETLIKNFNSLVTNISKFNRFNVTKIFNILVEKIHETDFEIKFLSSTNHVTNVFKQIEQEQSNLHDERTFVKRLFNLLVTSENKEFQSLNSFFAEHGIDVHTRNRDDRVKNALILLKKNQVHLSEKDISMACDACIAYLEREGKEKALFVLKGKCSSVEFFWKEPFGPLFESDETSDEGKEVIGRLWIFIQNISDLQDHKSALFSLVNALNNCIGNFNHRICNSGKIQNLVNSILQGRLAGVKIDEHDLVVSDAQAMEMFFSTEERRGITDKNVLLEEANRFCDVNPLVNRNDFLSSVELYHKTTFD